MAASNSWGLFLVLALMGHGLVAVPKSLWRISDPKTRLNELELYAVKVKEELENAESQLRELQDVRFIFIIFNIVGNSKNKKYSSTR